MATEAHEVYQDGVLVSSVQVPIPDEVHHERQIHEAARDALIANRAYIASTPTNAQTVAQIKALSRQINALIRLQLHDLSGTD